MLFNSFSHRSWKQHSARRANLEQRVHRSRIETFEDRRMLSFTPAANYGTGDSPLAVVTADFNNDGHLDLATANAGSSSVSVLLGNADGTLQAPLNSTTGANPLSLAVGDFNADGKLDIATANTSNASVLLGNGNGTFQSPASVGILGTPSSVAVGDVNGDGNLDLGVTSNEYYRNYYGYYYGYNLGRTNVLLGNGDGSFDVSVASLDYGYLTSATLADFNADGNLDFAATIQEYGYLVVLPGNGTDSFGSASYWSAPYYTQSMAAGDVNGDGRLDLAAAQYSDKVGVLLSTGTGSFAAPQYFTAGSNSAAVTLGDFTGDGTLDIATANPGSNNVSILRGGGDGTFGPPANIAVGQGPQAVAAGDFNGDGWLDVVTANSASDTLSLLLNDQSWPIPVASVSISDATVTEGNTGSTNATFTVTLSNAVGVDVTLTYDAANGSALAGSDYTAASGTVTIPAGQTTRTFTVAVLGDRIAESTETFVVNLSAPPNVTVGDGQGVGTILDNEPRISISDVSTTEGNSKQPKLFTFTISLSATYDQAVTVNYATANGTATSGSDYQSKSGTVTFAPGETIKTVTVAVIGDKQKEANETFFVNLSGATSGAIADSQGLGTILNDDGGGAKNRFNLFALAVDAAFEDWTTSVRKKWGR